MKKNILTTVLLSLSILAFAQERTAEELKTERETLKAEMKSEAFQNRQKKLADLKDPGSVGISSIDALVVNSNTVLVATKKNNEIIPELYKRTIGESIDGVTDVTVKKPTLDELLKVSENIVMTIKSVADQAPQLISAQGDIKSAGIMKVAKATKSLNYAKDVNTMTAAELNYQTKLIKNLIETLKSSKNY